MSNSESQPASPLRSVDILTKDVLFVPFSLLFVIYLFSMFLFPLIAGGWQNLMPTWKNWETFNGAMIAFFSAGVFFMAARWKQMEEHILQRLRYRSAMVFHMSKLCRYCIDCFHYVSECRRTYLSNPNGGQEKTYPKLPEFDENIIDLLSQASPYMDKPVATKICKIILDLQIMQSNLSEIDDALNGKGRIQYSYIDRDFLKKMSWSLILLKNVNSLFHYARDFEATGFSDVDYNDALGMVNYGLLISAPDSLYLHKEYTTRDYIYTT